MDPRHFDTDPDPEPWIRTTGLGIWLGSCSFRQWLSRCQQKISFLYFLAYFFLNIHLNTVQSQNTVESRNQGFSYFFSWWRKDTDPIVIREAHNTGMYKKGLTDLLAKLIAGGNEKQYLVKRLDWPEKLDNALEGWLAALLQLCKFCPPHDRPPHSLPHQRQLIQSWTITRPWLTIYAPMIYTAPCVMFFWCGQIHYVGKWEGGWALEMEFFRPCEMASSR